MNYLRVAGLWKRHFSDNWIAVDECERVNLKMSLTQDEKADHK